MEEGEKLPSKVSVEMSTVVVVKNRCQFCYAFFKDTKKIAEHSEQCEFRFRETFEAFDGKVKFACSVCFNVFDTRTDHARHEQLHKFPGGFPCTVCDDLFLNDLECVQHMENYHEVFRTGLDGGYSASKCNDCGAFFEQDSYLRLHMETNCGRTRKWHCVQCNLLTEAAFRNKEPREIHAQPKPVFVKSEVEETLIENDIAIAIETVGEDDSFIEMNIEDPLLWVPNERKYLIPGTDENRIVVESAIEDSIECNSDKKSNDKQHMTNEPLSGDNESDLTSDNIPERLFACKYCDKKYVLPKWLDKHISEHGPDGSLVHRCDCCLLYFKSADERDTHKSIAHAYDEKLRCEICDKSFRNMRALCSHNRAQHGPNEKDEQTLDECSIDGSTDSNGSIGNASISSEDDYDHLSDGWNDAQIINIPKPGVNEGTYECKYCGKKYFRPAWLKAHIAEHGPDGSQVHKCECCPNYFKSKEERDAHAMIAHKEKLTCKECNKSFRNIKTMQAHNRAHHKGREKRKNFVCVKCGVSYSDKKCLESHEQSDCGRAPRYKCDECGKCLSTKSSLKIHQTTHSGVRKFQCNLCGKKFINKRVLLIHTRYHTGEKPYQCDHCDKRFVDLCSKKLHTAVHTRIKRYVCHGCGDRFPTNSNLHKHRKTRKDSCALVPIQPPLKIDET